MKQMKLKNGKKKLYKYKYDFQQYETISLLVRAFIQVKLMQMKLKQSKAIYLKIWQNLMINLDQEWQKVKAKKKKYP